MKHANSGMAMLAGFLVSLCSVVQAPADFTSIYCFGDGVSTTTDNTDPAEQAKYYGQSFCNGRVWLEVLAQWQGTDLGRVKSLKVWTAVQAILFLILLVLAYTPVSSFTTIHGVIYLLSLGLAAVITVRMRQTIETTAESPEGYTGSLQA